MMNKYHHEMFNLIKGKDISKTTKIFLLFVFVFSISASCLAAYSTIVLNKIVNHLSDHKQALTLTVIYILFILLSKYLSDFRWYFYGKIESEIQTFLTQKYVKKTLQLPMIFHIHSKKGELYESLTKAILAFGVVNFNAVFLLLTNILDILFVVFFTLVYLEKPFFIVICVTIILYIGIVYISTEKIRSNQKKLLEENIKSQGNLTDILSNIDLIKITASEQFVLKKYEKLLKNKEKWNMNFFILRTKFNLIQSTIVTSGLAISLGIGLYSIQKNLMMAGEFIAISVYFFQIIRPLETSNLIYREIRNGFISINNLYRIMEEKIEEVFILDKESFPDKPSIHFKNVSFKYADKLFNLRNLNLDIKFSSKIAIVGESGSGKSTLSKLLCKIYEPHSGEILFNSTDIKKIDYHELRKKVCLLTQEPSLLNESIRYNLEIVLNSSNEEILLKAIDSVFLTGLIYSLPNGLDSIVGDNGSKLSGGQKQRIAIARSLLMDADIYIFDESTSAIDLNTEVKILENIFRILKNKTVIFITHRTHSLHYFDEIIYVESGNVKIKEKIYKEECLLTM